LASRSNTLPTPEEPSRAGPAPRPRIRHRATQTLGAWRSEGAARWLFVWPAVLLILALSIFPLVASVALSVSKLVFNPGHVDLSFIGFSNYQQLLFGLERSHFLGVLNRLAARDDEERLFLEDANHHVQELAPQMEVQQHEAQHHQERQAAHNAQPDPEQNHR
jgi:hypothetical protein